MTEENKVKVIFRILELAEKTQNKGNVIPASCLTLIKLLFPNGFQ